jgi:uncharacterized protein with GYD domain
MIICKTVASSSVASAKYCFNILAALRDHTLRSIMESQKRRSALIKSTASEIFQTRGIVFV